MGKVHSRPSIANTKQAPSPLLLSKANEGNTSHCSAVHDSLNNTTEHIHYKCMVEVRVDVLAVGFFSGIQHQPPLSVAP